MVLPVVTFVAGAYASTLGQVAVERVLSWALLVVIILGFLYYCWALVEMFSSLFYQHTAAAALREDLLDIQLLRLGEKNLSSTDGQ